MLQIYIDENLQNFSKSFQNFGKIKIFNPNNAQLSDFNLKNDCVFLISSKTLLFQKPYQASRIKFIGTATSGIDHIEKSWQNSPNHLFAHAKGSNSSAVCDYILSSLSSLIVQKKINPTCETLGIIGFGNIGKKVYQESKIFGFKETICYDPFLDPKDFITCSLNTLQKNATIFTLHCPLTKNSLFPTFEMIQKKWIQKIQHPFTLINAARGKLLCEKSVLQAIKQNKIKNLILDTFPQEPIISQELQSICHLTTPHIAGYTKKAKDNALSSILLKFCQYFDFSMPTKTHPQDLTQIIASDSIHACLQMYDIQKDHLNFKKMGQTTSFSEIRKNYHLRKEFSEFVIKISL